MEKTESSESPEVLAALIQLEKALHPYADRETGGLHLTYSAPEAVNALVDFLPVLLGNDNHPHGLLLNRLILCTHKEIRITVSPNILYKAIMEAAGRRVVAFSIKDGCVMVGIDHVSVDRRRYESLLQEVSEERDKYFELIKTLLLRWIGDQQEPPRQDETITRVAALDERFNRHDVEETLHELRRAGEVTLDSRRGLVLPH
jgi:hypothetical protein